jgi:hypothetical protein
MRRSLYKFATLFLSDRTAFFFGVFEGLEGGLGLGQVHELLDGEDFLLEGWVAGWVGTFHAITGMLIAHFGLASFSLK